jgi:hypothetical protein
MTTTAAPTHTCAGWCCYRRSNAEFTAQVRWGKEKAAPSRASISSQGRYGSSGPAQLRSKWLPNARFPTRIARSFRRTRDRKARRMDAETHHVLAFLGVDEVRELHSVADEEYRDVVAHQVPFPSSAWYFIAKPRTSCSASAAPCSPATVEKRASIGVYLAMAENQPPPARPAARLAEFPARPPLALFI